MAHELGSIRASAAFWQSWLAPDIEKELAPEEITVLFFQRGVEPDDSSQSFYAQRVTAFRNALGVETFGGFCLENKTIHEPRLRDLDAPSGVSLLTYKTVRTLNSFG